MGIGTSSTSFSGIGLSYLIKQLIANSISIPSRIGISQRVIVSSIEMTIKELKIATLVFLVKLPIIFTKYIFDQLEI